MLQFHSSRRVAVAALPTRSSFRVFFLNLAEEAFCSAPTGVSLDRGRATRLLFFLQALSLEKCSLKGSEIHAYLLFNS